MGRVFANGPGDLSSIPGRVIPKTLKMVLDTSLLNNQQFKVSINGKVEQSWERSSALAPTPRCSSYWKGSLHVTLDYGRQLYLPITSRCTKIACVQATFFFILLILWKSLVYKKKVVMRRVQKIINELKIEAKYIKLLLSKLDVSKSKRSDEIHPTTGKYLWNESFINTICKL